MLVGLANHAGPDGTGAFPSVATLVRYTGLSERTVRDTCLDRLEAGGIISRCDPEIVAARIKRADRRPQGWDLNLSLVRNDLDDAAVAVLEHQFPGLGVRLAAAAQPGADGQADGVQSPRPVATGGQRPGRRHVAELPDRHRRGPVLGGAGQLAVLLSDRARRPGLHPQRAAHGGGAPERPERDDLPDAERQQQRPLQGRPDPARRDGSTPPGGWWDAGDYLKFVQTTSYTVDLLLAGVRDFPAQMGPGSATSDFTAEAKFGADWLLRMWDDSTQTLYYQVGIGEGNAKTIGDHDIWRLPQADDTYGGTDPLYRYIRNRPVFRAGPPGSPISPNLAGRDAAALAEAFQVFKTSDPAFAARCLLAAEHIFDLANTAPSGNLLTVIPFSFYPETEWRDDLELGATELYFAVAGGGLPAGLPHTDPLFYLGRAAHWANAYITGPNDAADTLNLYDVSGLAHYELYRAIAQAGNPARAGGHPGAAAGRPEKAARRGGRPGHDRAVRVRVPVGRLRHHLPRRGPVGDGQRVRPADRHPGLRRRTASSGWRTSSARTPGGRRSSSATAPRSRTACSTRSRTWPAHLDGSPPVLAGAAVEGPNGTATKGLVTGMNLCPANGVDTFAQFNGHHAEWKDDMQSFSNTEPAVDLTAASPLAFARQMAGQT